MLDKELKKIPGVDKILQYPQIKELASKFGSELVTFAVRCTLDEERHQILEGKIKYSSEQIIPKIESTTLQIGERSLKQIVNATGIVLHTNLARAPLGNYILNELKPVVTGYSNLEFDLEKGKRGHRNTHISELIKFITKAEDAVVVNNNAAAVMLVLKTFAARKETIISRGELIEIGGSFRIPDIMKASGSKMVEVGTTNRTRISDYENAITDRTRIILKVHRSNYFIGGFTEEVELSQLVELADKHNLIFVYDIGSGLLRKPEGLPLENEPDVRSSIRAGVDIITFSGDKLLGGPQAGIIAGRKELISKLAKAPMMRALRVGKLTVSGLTAVMQCYLKDEDLLTKIPIFEMLNRSKEKLELLAKKLSNEFKKNGIRNEVIDSPAKVGGGTLPHLKIRSKAVKLIIQSSGEMSAKKIFRKLLRSERPVLGVLREGNILFDVQSIFEEDIPVIANSVAKIINEK
ncbi:MAG: L-seryl-tRNA(Sec) selenium transferase [Candidatus Cloacimonetes bacterium]|nr:L-seryl-tRNA(Sec) selenium transferase [Candidatus Cloacimonadota bacterium]